MVRYQGGGHKQRYRLIDFKRNRFNDPAMVERLEYDPNRTAFIALIKYKDGTQAYILAPQRLNVGDTVVSGDKVDVKVGNAMPLGAMPVGTIVHNIEMKPGKGGQVARSAGAYAQYLGRDGGYALVRLNSSEVRKIPLTCMATVGAVSNPDHMNEVIGKAGRNVWKGKRPSRARHRHEPDRPSPWRRRRPHQGRPSSGHALGQAHQGRQDPRQQAHHQVHRAHPQRQGKHMTRSIWKGPFVDGYLLKKAEAARAVRPQGRDQDLVAPFHHPAAVRGRHLRRL